MKGWAAAALALVSCLTPVRTGPTCASCHGDATSAAPPSALGGATATTANGVGAHRAHVDGGTLGVVVACDECHAVPTTVDAPGHLDDWPAEVAWGPLARTGGATTPWDRTAGTCTVYCHGASLGGGDLTEPVWTQVDGTQTACGSCHGTPPPDPHPQQSDCETCHPALSAVTHVNGVVEAAGAACAGCHGDADTLAPPPDTSGGTDTTLVTVGAHRAHVDGGEVSNPVPCATCHVVPGAVGDPSHLDGSPAEVVFSGIAVSRGAAPVWNGATCADSYCHGAAVPGGSLTEPAWTIVDGSQAACGTCHGAPPPSPHPQSSSCSSCHDTAGPGLTIAHPERHVDGRVDL